MKKINLLISMICAGVAFFAIDEAFANSCFLASESGSSTDCDSGTAQSGLPVHDMKTTSKAGTMGLCNNVNVFADKKQAEEYAKTHEYDYVSASSGCYKPQCAHTSDCSNNAGKVCCKSLVNNECWHECNICTFNKVGRAFYPYADDSLEGCMLVGYSGMEYVSLVYNKHIYKNYKINTLRNLEPLNDINDDIWFCDNDEVGSILGDCIQKVGDASYIAGYDENTTLNVSYLCINGSEFSLSQNAESFIQEHGCPLSAVKCNESKLYYNDEGTCQRKSLNNNPCSVVVTYKGYGESECWHSAERCSDFGHGDYITGNYNSLTCPTNSNTELQYYLNKVTGKVVELNDRKCGACECISGKTRLSSCNDVLYDISKGYYNAKETCEFHGYTTSADSVSSGNCTACPYNAMYWKCN